MMSNASSLAQGDDLTINGTVYRRANALKYNRQAAGYVETVDSGPIIVIMSQYAVLGKGKTIHSKWQMEHFGISIDDKSCIAGGNQCLITQEGHVIPLHIREGLPRMNMRPPTDDKELEEYPHVFLAYDTPWDPTVLDCEFNDTFYDALSELPEVVSRRETRDPRGVSCSYVLYTNGSLQRHFVLKNIDAQNRFAVFTKTETRLQQNQL